MKLTHELDIDKSWENCLSSLRHDFYHLPGYNVQEADRIGGEAEFYKYTEGKKLFLIPYIRRSCASLPWAESWGTDIYDVTSAYGYPAPLFSSEALEDPVFINNAISSWLVKLRSDNVCSVFLRFHPLLDSPVDVWRELGLLIENGETVTIDLSWSIEEMWRRTRKNHKSHINKLKRRNVEPIWDKDWKYFDKKVKETRRLYFYSTS